MYVLSFMYSVIADAGRLSEYAQLERTISSSSLTSGYAPLTLTVKKRGGGLECNYHDNKFTARKTDA